MSVSSYVFGCACTAVMCVRMGGVCASCVLVWMCVFSCMDMCVRWGV